MSRFRIVGISCDAQSRYTDDGDRVDTYGPRARGTDCGEEHTLYGGATYADVNRQASQDGWRITAPGIKGFHLCPEHINAIESTNESR